MNLIQLNEENNNEINSHKKMNIKSIEKEENEIYKANAKLEEVHNNKVDFPIINKSELKETDKIFSERMRKNEEQNKKEDNNKNGNEIGSK